MWLFKISALSTIILTGFLIPLFVIYQKMRFYLDPFEFALLDSVFNIICYAAVVSAAFFMCLVAVRIRSGFKGTRLMMGNRHLHEGTIGIVFVLIGVVWNTWHFFDEGFQFGINYTIGWLLTVGGILWIIIGAILIGRDWDDVKHGKFFNKEDE